MLADVLTLKSREEEEDRLKRDMKLPDPLQGRTWKEKEWRGEKMKKGKEKGETRIGRRTGIERKRKERKGGMISKRIERRGGMRIKIREGS